MNWNLDQLQAFISTVQQGSFSGAARELNKAQSGISLAISNLETDIGFELFNRSKRYPTLTEKGQNLYPQALYLLQQSLQLDAQIAALALNRDEKLTLAMDEAFPEQALDKALKEIELRFPHLQLTLINGSQGDIENYVSIGQADLGLLVQNKPVNDDLYAVEIGHLNYCTVSAYTHPLAQIEEVRVLDLLKYRQYVSCNKQGKAYNRAISSNCWYLDSYFYILPLIAQNGGWASIPQNIVEHPIFGKGLVKLNVQELSPQPALAISIIKRRNFASKEIDLWLIDYLGNHF